jgi:hypothetical protein
MHLVCSYGIVASPSDPLALSNRLVVNPSDFAPGQHVLVKKQFPLTTMWVARICKRLLLQSLMMLHQT